MSEQNGRDPHGSGLSHAEPQGVSALSGFDPSRDMSRLRDLAELNASLAESVVADLPGLVERLRDWPAVKLGVDAFSSIYVGDLLNQAADAICALAPPGGASPVLLGERKAMARLTNIGPQLGAEAGEPSIRMLATTYYGRWFDAVEADRLADAYCAQIDALAAGLAEARPD